ncbi:MAG TPA: outer membrane lipoprotein carrier protein LolA [Bacteroidales bacterium]|nr:outer membrane lipoprotein carrier protein LolA [Bacteroidales bacterium]
MRILILTFCSSIIMIFNVYGQSDPEAVRILDKFSSTALAAPSIFMKFDLVTDDQLEGTNNTASGSIILSKDKYKLEMPDNMIWFNGETSWNYLPAEKEVTITRADRKDDSFQSKPSAIFSMYKKGYKNRLVEERPESYLIDLYPEDIKTDLIRVRLTLDRSSLDLKSLEYKNRDGLTVTLNVKEYNLKQKPDASVFSFAPGQYKGVEIIDMR